LLFFLIVLEITIFAGALFTVEKFYINRKVLEKAQAKYGKAALTRLVSWEKLIQDNSGLTDMEKLRKVNSFFNKQIIFVNDIDLYGKKDYWATPIEFLCRGAGDCEDYAIAKYFSLKIMGIPEEKLRITYVKALRQNIPHMVMAYYGTPGAEPLILDNLVDSIKRSSERMDLLPIFTFNGTGLWLAHYRGQGKLAGKSGRLTAWKNLLQKMAEDKI
jgi:predicted transglutaminase-like cysteine proteinase